MSETFFTADTHFGHKMLVEKKLRPFDSVEEMDEAIIERWNAVVRDKDVVYHLGDVSFRPDHETVKILSRLNGQIRLVRGNHDRFNAQVKNKFQWIKAYYEVTAIGNTKLDQIIVLCHYPFEAWNKSHHGSYHLFGHKHGSLKTMPHAKRIDACVEDNSYSPWSYDSIKDMMDVRGFEPADHHR